MSKLRVLIADDSAIIRGLFEKALKEHDFEVAGMVSNGRKAVDFCKNTSVDFVLSDYDMPELNGAEAAKLIVQETGISVIIYSDDLSVKAECISAGALSFLKKPQLSSYNSQMMDEFVARIKSAVSSIKPSFRHGADLNSSGTGSATSYNSEPVKRRSFGEEFKVLCIGASTGGPSAVQKVLSGLGENFPLPVLYAQHLDIGSDEKMAKWFCDTCPNIPMTLAKDGEIAKSGHVYLAPADKHLVIDYAKNDVPVLHLSDEPPERFLRPAVNKLFRSAAKTFNKKCLAVLMTGMGRDGAEGCKEIVDAGGYTICEDKSTCTVFGMPAAAIEMNAATKVFPRDKIAQEVLKLVR